MPYVRELVWPHNLQLIPHPGMLFEWDRPRTASYESALQKRHEAFEMITRGLAFWGLRFKTGKPSVG